MRRKWFPLVLSFVICGGFALGQQSVTINRTTSGGSSSSSSSSDTCTGDSCVIHDGGSYDDGGISGVVTALRYVSTVGGNGGDLSAFTCLNQTAASSPCFSTEKNLMEIFSRPSYTSYASASSSQPGALLSVRNPDGGTSATGSAVNKANGYLFCVYNNENVSSCVDALGGLETNMNSQGGFLTLNANSANAAADITVPTSPGGYMRFNSTPSSTTADSFIFWTHGARTGGYLQSWFTAVGGTQIGGVDYKGGIAIGGTTVVLDATAPTVPVACTSPTITNGNASMFTAGVGTSCTGISTISFTLPTATNGWDCTGSNLTTAARNLVSTAWSTTSVTMTNVARTTGLATDFADSTSVRIRCMRN